DRLAYGPTFESAMAALFGGGVSSLSAAALPPEAGRNAEASGGSPRPAADLNALIAEAAKDLADYQRLTAEGKLGEARSEEHTSELQSLRHLVCRLLL